MRHIGNPGIVRTVYSDPFRHTQGHSAIFSDVHVTAQKMKFSIKDFFCKCDQNNIFLRIWSHLLKKSLMENFIFCTVCILRDILWHIQALLRQIKRYSGIFRPLCNTSRYNHAIFKTLTHLEPEASSKACRTCKMMRHIHSLGKVRTVYSGISRIFRDIPWYWWIFCHTITSAQLGMGGGGEGGAEGRWGGGRNLPCRFFKIEKSALIFEKKYPDHVHLWVKSSIQNVVLRVSRQKSAKCSPAEPFFLVLFTKCLSKCSSSTKHLLPRKISGWLPTLRHYSFWKTLHLKCLTVFWICLSL